VLLGHLLARYSYFVILRNEDRMAEFPLNGIAHVDIAGPDGVALQQFYREVFDWEVTAKGAGYALVTTPDGGPNGAIVEAETSSVTIAVVVADLAATLERAVGFGGSELMSPMDNGWVLKAQLCDPAGNAVTLIQR
jgi:predicted enzyme related to lactoylglutathione lyase